MDILVVLPLSFKRNLQHFSLAAQHLSLHPTMTWWFHSPGCQCCILLRLARGLPARHDRTLSWSRWNYDRAPSDVPSAFPPVASNWISVLWCCDLKPACSSSKICSAWFTSLLRITHSMTLLRWQIYSFLTHSPLAVVSSIGISHRHWLLNHYLRLR